MRKLLVLIIIFLFCSCEEYSPYIQGKNESVVIVPKGISIEEAKILKWKVGSGFLQTISKGILIKIKFPVLEKKHLKHLIKIKNVDSWLIRVSRDNLGVKKVLGYVYAPLRTQVTRNYVQNSSGHFAIYYAAASPSPRFENFYCPAFHHQKLIEGVEIIKRKLSVSKIVISDYGDTRVRNKLKKFSIRPITINGGMELQGKYNIEIAAFSKVNKRRKSDFVKYSDIIDVKYESEVQIRGCVNSKIPSRKDNEMNKNLQFKFGR